MELGFIDFVCRPLYVKLAAVCPGLGPHCLACIDRNREMWAAVLARSSDGTRRRSLDGAERPRKA
jgi:hypothetical protein